MVDTHIHTERFSKDSCLTINEIQEVLGSRNKVDMVCICEHMDFGSYVTDEKRFNVNEYFREYQTWQDILLGIEIGLDPHYDEINEFAQIPFDYIVGSIHGYCGNNLYNNPSIYKKDKIEFYRDYFQYTVHCLEQFRFIDSYAHFDYVSRYAPYVNPVMDYHILRYEFELLFHVLLENEILLEVNTKQIMSLENLRFILEGYQNAGGKYVTLGSDSHCHETLFKDFGKIYPMIREAGLEAVYFKQRKRVIVQ